MFRQRNTRRFQRRSAVRKLDRSAVRTRWTAPDDLGEALSALARAIRASRRLARLAPQFFDVAVVQREAENRAEERRWRAIWEPVLRKVYGAEPGIPDNNDEAIPLPPRRIQRVVEQVLAEREGWIAIAETAWERQRQCHPHALPSLGRLARIIQLAGDLKNSALGLDSRNPLPEKMTDDSEWADLKRAYGHLGSSVASIE